MPSAMFPQAIKFVRRIPKDMSGILKSYIKERGCVLTKDMKLEELSPNPKKLPLAAVLDLESVKKDGSGAQDNYLLLNHFSMLNNVLYGARLSKELDAPFSCIILASGPIADFVRKVLSNFKANYEGRVSQIRVTDKHSDLLLEQFYNMNIIEFMAKAADGFSVQLMADQLRFTDVERDDHKPSKANQLSHAVHTIMEVLAIEKAYAKCKANVYYCPYSTNNTRLMEHLLSRKIIPDPCILEVPIYSQKKQEYLPMSILSPYEVYQDFISTPDSALEQAFNCLTPLNPTERTKILDQHWVDPSMQHGQKELTKHIIDIIFGDKIYEECKLLSDTILRVRRPIQEPTDEMVEMLDRCVHTVELKFKKGMTVTEMITDFCTALPPEKRGRFDKVVQQIIELGGFWNYPAYAAKIVGIDQAITASIMTKGRTMLLTKSHSHYWVYMVKWYI